MMMLRRVLFSLAVLLAFLAVAHAGGQTQPVFVSSTPVSIGSAVPRHIVLADFNGDGFNDVASIGYVNNNEASTLYLEIHLADYHGVVNRGADAQIAVDQCTLLEGMASFGTDSGGNTNLAILCYDSVQIWHVINNKSTTTPVALSSAVSARQVVPLPNGALFMAVGDFTGAGANGVALLELSGSDRSIRYLPPVVCSTNCSSQTSFIPITTAGAVVLDVSTLLGANQIATALASYQLPADVFPYPLLAVATVATTGNCGGYVQPIIYKASTGSFAAAGTNLTIKAPYCPQALATGDLNNDGVPDLVIAGPNSNGNTSGNGFITTFLGLGNGGFSTSGVNIDVFAPLINSNELLAVADINGDGKADILASGPRVSGFTGSQDIINYYLGDGGGNSDVGGKLGANNLMSGSTPVGGGVNAIVVNNIDGDGALDIVALNIVGSNVGGSIVNSNLLNTATQTFSGRAGLTTSLRLTGVAQTVGGLLTVTIQGGTTFSGWVQFYDTTAGAFVGSTQIFNGNQVTFNVYGSGTHGYVASYYGNDTYTGSSSGTPVFLALGSGSAAAATTTTLAASSTSVAQGGSVTFTSTTTSISTPTGSVTFFDGSTSLGTGSLDGSGKATLSTSSLAAGTHSITAVYAGNSSFAASTSSAVSVVVAAPAASTTTLTVSNANPTVGTSITFTATSSGTGGTPTGTVTFYDSSVLLGTGTLDGTGKATYSTSSLNVATHPVTALYSGDAKFATSTSAVVAVTVKALGVTTNTLTASAASITAGQSETLSVKVTSTATGTPTGSVTFKDGTATLSTGTLDGTGAASFATTALAVGTHTLTAIYAGDSTFATSTSAAVTVTVTAAVPASLAIGVSPTSVTIKQGQSAMVTFTATPAGGYTGSVTLGCGGLPKGASCLFNPATITLTGNNAVTTSQLTISTTAAHASQSTQASAGSGLVRAMLAVGFGLFVWMRRRKLRMAPLLVAVLMVSVLLGMAGCADNSSFDSPNATPAGAYTVTVNATVSGATVQTAPLSVTITQ